LIIFLAKAAPPKFGLLKPLVKKIRGFMLEVSEVSKKLWNLVKDKNPGLDDVGVQKKVDNLTDLAIFLVRSWAKEHDRTAKNHPGSVFGDKTRDPPS